MANGRDAGILHDVLKTMTPSGVEHPKCSSNSSTIVGVLKTMTPSGVEHKMSSTDTGPPDCVEDDDAFGR